MRFALSPSIAYPKTEDAKLSVAEWLQAGFKSFAYRLAHLALPRALVVLSVSAIAYLV
jgi:hypothetical protein